MSRLQEVLSSIDALHSQDPGRTDGKASELIYAERMTSWLGRLEPDASEELQIAVRSQHLCRWEVPRSEYPEGRVGYLQWRAALGKRHADRAVDLMGQQGYNAQSRQQTYRLIRKLNLKRNQEAQTLEDCACLVFLEFEFTGFAGKHTEEKLILLFRKPGRKCQSRRKRLHWVYRSGPSEQRLLQKALNPEVA